MSLRLFPILLAIFNRYIPNIYSHSTLYSRCEYFFLLTSHNLYRSQPLYTYLLNYDRMSDNLFKQLNLSNEGVFSQPDYKIFFSDSSGSRISPWHFTHVNDIVSRDVNGSITFPMVVEISKNQLHKLEISTKLKDNPIVQDMKNGAVRLYPKPNPFNYGAMPRTWENPNEHIEENGVKYFGDNDPLDLVEISPDPYKPGEILTVKVLGALGLIDQDELDWKLIVISTCNQHYKEINNIEDAERFYPNIAHDILYWYKTYKVPNNKFLRNEQYFNVEETMKIIENARKAYDSQLWKDEKLV